MADEILSRDQNFVTVLAGVTNDSDLDIKMLRVDPITKRLLVSATGFDASVTLADVSANSTDATKSLYTMTSGVNVEFRSSDGTSILKIEETNKQALFRASFSGSVPGIAFDGDTNTGITWVSADQIGIYTGGGGRMFFTTSAVRGGASGSYSISTSSAYTASDVAYSFRGDENTGMYSDTADTIRWSTGGTNTMSLTTTGLGILTTTTSSPLHVIGAMRSQRSGTATQYILLDGGDTTSGYITQYSATGSEKGLTLASYITGAAPTDAQNYFAIQLGQDTNTTRLLTGTADTGIKLFRKANTNQFLQVNGGDSGGIYLTGQANTGAEKFLYISNFTNGTATVANGMSFRVGDIGSPITAATINYLGNVGIGTTTPSKLLEVAQATGSAILSLRRSDTTIFGGNVLGELQFTGDGDGTAKVGAKIVGAVASAENWGANDYPAELQFYTTPDGSATATQKAVLTSGGNFGIGLTAPTHRLDAYISSSSTGVSTIYGLRDIPSGTISSGSSINGVQGQLTVSGSTTITTITATAGNFIAEHDGSSTVHALVGLRGQARTNAASTGVLAAAYSIYAVAPANQQAGNTITNAYSLYIESPTAGATLNYGLYQTGSANNYFGGNVGIGVTTPTAVLHLKAGTATASTAPLKFTSGTNLTTAEAGAMEYNGTNLFFTRTGTTRETVNTTVTKTDTGDGTGAEGLFQINTFDNTFKVYAEGAWRTLATW